MPVYVRLARGIRSHFIIRRSEWGSTAGLLYLGVAFAAPGNSLDVPNLRNLGHLMSESSWAWLCLTVGLARLVALAMNGTFAHTTYGRLSPHVRAGAAFIGCMVWSGLAYGVMATPSSWSPPISILMGLLVIFAAQDAFNWRGAVAEAGEADRDKRHAGP